jgi:hypothetical protein
MRHAYVAVVVTVAVVAMLLLGGCSIIEASSLSITSARWNDRLRDREMGRTRYSRIVAIDPLVSRVEGLRVWEGTYGRMPIALYTKFMVSRHYLHASDRAAGLLSLGVVLVAEPIDDGGRVILATTVFPYSALSTDQLVVDASVRPVYLQQLRIGAPIVKVVSREGSRLEVTIKALTEPRWCVFDLATLLPDAREGPDGTVVGRQYPRLSPAGFTEWVLRRTARFPRGEDRHLGVREIAAMDHPLWRNATSVSNLLQRAESHSLVYALKFMRRIQYLDPLYLPSLSAAQEHILNLGCHPDPEVRHEFSQLLFNASVWPRDVSVLDPLLASDDVDVQSAVLASYVRSSRQPANKERVEELAKSSDPRVSSWAQDILMIKGPDTVSE